MSATPNEAAFREYHGLPPAGTPTIIQRVEQFCASGKRGCRKLRELWYFDLPDRDKRDADRLRFTLVVLLHRHVEASEREVREAVVHWYAMYDDQIAARRTDNPSAPHHPEWLGRTIRREYEKVIANEEIAAELVERGQHDTENAARFVALHGERIRYVVEENRFRVYDGQAWTADDKSSTQTIGLTEDVGRELEAAAASLDGGSPKAREARRNTNRALSLTGRRAIATLAKSIDSVRASASEFDVDPNLLACVNGTVDLRTGRVREHRPGDMLRVGIDCSYDPDAEGPRWDRFVEQALPDASVRRYVQKALGYAATGNVGERQLFVLLGELGREGKTTLLRAISQCLGAYASVIPDNLLLRNERKNADEMKSKLLGVRLAHGSDLTGDGAAWDAGLVKELTGGDEVSARDVYASRLTFQPTHTFVIASNHFPSVSSADSDTALWDRMRVIPFERRVLDPDPNLGEALKNEMPRTVAWLVEGAVAWAEEGLDPPGPVLEATHEARIASDRLLGWLVEHLRAVKGGRVGAQELWETYVANGKPGAYGHKTFPRAVEARGYHRDRDASGAFWVGVEVIR